MPWEYGMEPLIPDFTTVARMEGLEKFLERYLGPRRPEYGVPEEEVKSIQMPLPLQRFFRFAGRWPWRVMQPTFVNRFCVQDSLWSIVKEGSAPELQMMDKALVFVWENQGCWVAATDPAGADPPVWITQEWGCQDVIKQWRRLEKPLSHFLVSFVLQEILFGSQGLRAVSAGALEKFEAAGMRIEPVWIKGEYATDIDRPSYYLVAERLLVRRALREADGDDWYGCENESATGMLKALGMPTEIP